MTRKFDRSNSIRCVEYWLKRGLTESEGREKISQLQKNINSKRKNKSCSQETKEKLRVSNKKLHNVNYWIEKHGENGLQLFNEFKKTYEERGKKTSQLLKLKNVNRKEMTPRRKEFWLKKGFTEEQSTKKVSEIQSTFSLKKCIEIHGEERGTEIWKSRQKKWLESFNKDLDNIREKQRKNSHVGFYSSNNLGNTDELLFYLLLLDNNSEKVLKYGLTKNNIKQRWGVNRKAFSYTEIYSCKLNSSKAVELETMLRNKYRNKSKTNTFKLTEIIDVDELENVKLIIEGYIRSLND